jgi:hypothetical protein
VSFVEPASAESHLHLEISDAGRNITINIQTLAGDT